MRLRPHILSFLICLIVCCNFGFGQFARFRHITAEHGLAQNNVSCFVQDNKGFMWIGTQSGLSKYDGIKITTLKGTVDDTTGLYSNAIRCLYTDKEDNLWGGTYGGGLFRIDLKTGRISKYYVDTVKTNWISSNNVYSIKEFESGRLFLATNDGLNIFDKKTGRFTTVRKMGKNTIPFLSDNIRQMAKDTRGHIWFTHPNAGITEYDPRTGKCNYYTSQTKNRINANSVRYLMADSKGLIWVSCWNAGSNIIDTKTGKIYSSSDTSGKFKNLRNASLVSQFYEDSKGNVWVATAEKGLGKFEADTYEFTSFENNKDDPETIADNTVLSLYEDKSGLIWAGTWKGGASIMDPKTLRFGYYKHENNKTNSIHTNNVFSFAQKSKDEIYVGTGAAISVFNTKTNSFSLLPIDPKDPASLKDNSTINSLFNDTDSSLWISTGGGSLYRYHAQQRKKYSNYASTSDTNSFSYHTSYTILKDTRNRIWIATWGGGLNLYNKEKNNFSWVLSDKNDPSTISSNNLTHLLLDKSGKIWIGTSDNGLCLFDPDTRKAKRYILDKNNKPIFPDNGITTMFFDSKGNFWVGTSGGLCLFDVQNEKAELFSKAHPVFLGLIFGIQEDKRGNIWFSSTSGLVKFDPSSKDYTIFSTADGIQGREFSMNATLKSNSGKMYFGGINGFNAFDPEQIEANQAAPEVAITGFSVLNDSRTLDNDIAYTKEIKLSYKDYFFSFDFAALDYTNPQKNIYEYKLEPFNEKWVNIGTKPSVTFTNLDPGEYTLLIRAANNDGIWSKAPTSIKIFISPPFWRTTWFYIICAVSLILLIYFYIKWREQKLVQEKAVLEKKVDERTVELKIEKQKVETAHKDIKDSINYAKKIQEAILPEEVEIKKHLKDYFILYKPKDIVAGDFYWFHAISQELGVRSSGSGNSISKSLKNSDSELKTLSSQLLIAAADCTGHGVPGAFMSMIGSTFLNEIVRSGITLPHAILDELNVNVRRALKQNSEGSQSRDGMDIALCSVDFKNKKLYYAGANRPCLIVRGNEILEYKADKFPVGGLYNSGDKFTLNEIELLKGDVIYLFSDGYADQFGGPKGKKFMHKNLKELLISISSSDMTLQKEKLDSTISEWRGHSEQVDDILVIGVRI